jgi:hypothetical protein
MSWHISCAPFPTRSSTTTWFGPGWFEFWSVMVGSPLMNTNQFWSVACVHQYFVDWEWVGPLCSV